MTGGADPLDAVAVAVAQALAGRCEVPEGTPVVAACSGGADSVALVHALGRCQGRWPLRAVCFVDHGLRDVGAERAAARGAAEAVGLPLTERAVTVRSGDNLQQAAREARYLALEALAGGDGVVATGHTLSDQAETMLQRLVRGAGLLGLAGIRWREGRRVRPLLGVARGATRALGRPFADDPTNATGRFQRNRLRQRVLPLLREENPRVEEALAAAAHAVQDELALLDALAARIDADADLGGGAPELVEALVRWRLRRERPEARPPSRGAAAELARRLAAGGAAGRISLGDGVAGVTDGGRLRLEDDADPRLALVARGPGTYRLGQLALDLVEAPASAPDRSLTPTSTTPDHGAAVFDADALHWPLTLRAARPRDVIALAGPTAEPPRALREVLAEAGAASPWRVGRGRDAVLVDGVGEVLWVPGVVRSRAAATGPGTRRVVRARVAENSQL